MPKLLVAEDDELLLKAFQIKLETSGFEVKYAADGDELLAILKTFKPDLIVLDLVMPKKDGFFVLEQLKTNRALKKIPVLVTSNLGQKEDIDRAKALGAKAYIVKTDISLDEVVAKITALISRHAKLG